MKNLFLCIFLFIAASLVGVVIQENSNSPLNPNSNFNLPSGPVYGPYGPLSWQYPQGDYILRTYQYKQYFLTSDGSFWKLLNSPSISLYDQVISQGFDDFFKAWTLNDYRTGNNFQAQKILSAKWSVAFPPTISKVSGTTLQLSDGSSWKIQSFDQPTLQGWQVGDAINIEAGEATGTTYTLKNYRTTNTLTASPEQTFSALQGQHLLISDPLQTSFLILDNLSVWQPTLNTQALSSWKQNDPIVVSLQAGQYVLSNQRVKNSQITATYLSPDY